MIEKTKTDREILRMQLYCDVYVSLAKRETASKDAARAWAQGAVKAFDEQFSLINEKLEGE